MAAVAVMVVDTVVVEAEDGAAATRIKCQTWVEDSAQ